MIKLTCASRRLSPGFFKIGRAGELLGQNRPKQQADQKSCNEKVVKVLSQHIERFRRKNSRIENIYFCFLFPKKKIKIKDLN